MDLKLGQQVKVTITHAIRRDAARKTIERLFMKDQKIAGPIDERSQNFADRPKRRGGRIWTKHANKVHPNLVKGVEATIIVTDQVMKDLKSVAEFVELAAA
jgi:hypothetical protein